MNAPLPVDLAGWLGRARRVGARRLLLRPGESGAWIHLRGGVRPARFPVGQSLYWNLLAEVRGLGARLGGSSVDQALQVPTGSGRVGINCRLTETAQGLALSLALQGRPLLMGLGRLGLDPRQRLGLERFLERPRGCLVVAGPTGSGRSSTLYSLLQHSLGTGRVVVTVEHVVHRRLEGATQVRVDWGRGVGPGSVTRAVRGALRLAPDVLFLAESNLWSEAVRPALDWAREGGLLLVNGGGTRDAAGALERLASLGQPGSLRGVPLMACAQERLDLLCPSCREAWEPDPLLLERLGEGGNRPERAGPPRFLRPVGCRLCRGRTGPGRTACFELLLAPHGTPAEARGLLRAEPVGPSLREHALALARGGVVSLEQVLAALY